VSTSAHRRDPHLGGLVAAVVDGALDHEARERALGHLARCDACRAEVEAQRRIKARLSGLGGPEVPAGLAERLLALPDGTAAGPARVAELPQLRIAASFRPRVPAAAGPSDRARPVAGRPAGRVARRRVAGAAAGGIAAFALSLATVLVLGSPDRAGTIVPAVDSYTVEHSRTAVGVPGADPVVELAGLTVSGGR
jgi:anti-sigma factor RsiW